MENSVLRQVFLLPAWCHPQLCVFAGSASVDLRQALAHANTSVHSSWLSASVERTGRRVLPHGYDYPLVVLSVLIAMGAAYSALDLTGRTAASSGRVRAAWIAGGAVAMAPGIWSMRYIGMLAYLSKPVRQTTLLAAVRTVWANSRNPLAPHVLVTRYSLAKAAAPARAQLIARPPSMPRAFWLSKTTR